MSQIVADRYAEALFEIAKETGLVDRMDQELTLMTQTVAENADLRVLFAHPLVSREDKKSVAVKIFGPHIHPITLNFVQLLFDKNRGNIIELIQARFHHLASRMAKRLIVQLTTAVPVPPEDIERFRELLEREWDRKLEVEHQVDGNILGGARMKVEDQVIDGSIRGALDRLRDDMMHSA